MAKFKFPIRDLKDLKIRLKMLSMLLDDARACLLNNPTRHKMNLPGWKSKKITPQNGIYIVWEEKYILNTKGVQRTVFTIIYIGEASNVRGRMGDLKRRNHDLYTKIGKRLFTDPKFQISYIPTEIGRKEIEEIFIAKYRPKYNDLSKKKFKRIYPITTTEEKLKRLKKKKKIMGKITILSLK